MKIELPYPPSVNMYYATRIVGKPPKQRSIMYITKDGNTFAANVRALLHNQQPIDGRLRVTIHAYLPDARTRDLDNIQKPLLDACTKGGLWGDDKQIRDLRIIDEGIERPNGRVVVEVESLESRLF